MILKYLLPLLALSGFAFASWRVAQASKPMPPAAPAAEPARPPYAETIAGAGLVEARSQNIALAASLPGIVAEVAAQVGMRVERGDALVRIDAREQQAELVVRESALASARAELARLQALPRAEDLPPVRARLVGAEAELADVRRQLELAESVQDKRAIAMQEWERRRFAVRAAEARVQAAQAELARSEAGAWEPDLALARAAVASAQARLDAQATAVERLVVRASVDGTILAVNARVGEFAPAGALNPPLLVLGDLERMHVRVDIDENDAWRFRPGARATAFVRGNRELSVELDFVRVDPYVIPKRSLTGESTERVDTRVLQVLYAFDPARLQVYVGQQMDVFVEAPRGKP